MRIRSGGGLILLAPLFILFLVGAHGVLVLGDSFEVLRRGLDDNFVDLIYLDPPFNSQRRYDLFLEGKSTPAFDDRWSWNETREKELPYIKERMPKVGEFVDSFLNFLGRSSSLSSYLVMMTARLVELYRVLKPTGSLYLHCDPTVSHYLKIILDQIFGPNNFRNEIIWKRTSSHNLVKRWSPVHDVILFYTKSEDYKWNKLYLEYDEEYLKKEYRKFDDRGFFSLSELTGPGPTSGDSGNPWRGIDPTLEGRHWAIPKRDKFPPWFVLPDNWENMSAQEKLDYLDANGFIYWPPKGKRPKFKRYLEFATGVPIQDVITDIYPVGSQSKERCGYPTQKPLELLKRIVSASSQPGDIVLDPFCGSGTTLIAAHSLGRRWIGIDISPEAVSMAKLRLDRELGLSPEDGYEFISFSDDQ